MRVSAGFIQRVSASLAGLGNKQVPSPQARPAAIVYRLSVTGATLPRPSIAPAFLVLGHAVVGKLR